MPINVRRCAGLGWVGLEGGGAGRTRSGRGWVGEGLGDQKGRGWVGLEGGGAGQTRAGRTMVITAL